MPSKAEREQAKIDSVATRESRSSRIAEIFDLALLGKDIIDLLIAEIRVVKGDATETDLVEAKKRKAGLDGRLDEIRARFRRDTGADGGIDNT